MPACSPATSSGALQAMDAARPVLAPLSPVSRAVGDQDRAEVLTAAGRAREAIVALRVRRVGVRRPRPAHLPGRVRADAVAHPAARGPRPGPSGRPSGRAAFPGQGSEVQVLRAEAVATMAEIGEDARRWPCCVVPTTSPSPLRAASPSPRRGRAAAPGSPAGRASGRARGRPRTHRESPRHRGLPRRDAPAVARGALRAGAGARRSSARAQPRACRPGRPARMAVVIRQPRPAEHPGGARARPGAAGSATGARGRLAGTRLRVVGARSGARGQGHARPAAHRRASGRGADRAARAVRRRPLAALVRGPPAR